MKARFVLRWSGRLFCVRSSLYHESASLLQRSDQSSFVAARSPVYRCLDISSFLSFSLTLCTHPPARLACCTRFSLAMKLYHNWIPLHQHPGDRNSSLYLSPLPFLRVFLAYTIFTYAGGFTGGVSDVAIAAASTTVFESAVASAPAAFGAFEAPNSAANESIV